MELGLSQYRFDVVSYNVQCNISRCVQVNKYRVYYDNCYKHNSDD